MSSESVATRLLRFWSTWFVPVTSAANRAAAFTTTRDSLSAMSRKIRSMGAAALVLLVTVTSVTPGGAGGYRERATVLAPGVVYKKITDPRGPWSIRVVDITLAEASTIEPVLASGKLPGFETTTSMA